METCPTGPFTKTPGPDQYHEARFGANVRINALTPWRIFQATRVAVAQAFRKIPPIRELIQFGWAFGLSRQGEFTR